MLLFNTLADMRRICLTLTLTLVPMVGAQADTTPLGIPAAIMGHDNVYHQLLIQQRQVQQYRLQLQRDTLRLTHAETKLKVLAQQAQALHSDFVWMQYQTKQPVPANAVPVDGSAKTKAYICQAGYLNYRYPGLLTDKGCVVTYAGRAMVQKNDMILTSTKPIKWVASDAVPPAPDVYRVVGFPMPERKKMTLQQTDKILYQPINGGYERDHYVYICRTQMLGAWHVGKVVSGECDVAWKNKEATLPDYQVLTTGAKATKDNLPPTHIIPMGPGPVRLGKDDKPL